VASVPPIVVPTEAASVADRLPPGVSLRIDPGTVRTVRVRGLRLALGTSEACRARIDVRVDAPTARRLRLPSRTIGRASVRLAAAGRHAITVRISARARRARRALPRATRVRIVARAVAVDAAGNRRGAERAATLRR
jgi:hypothetical protein